MPAPSHATQSSAPLLAARGISKRFGVVRALTDVNLDLRAGSVLALLGENGAGKSTLIKCLTGVHRRDAGELRLDGREISPGSPLDAERAGISTVYQEINLIPHMTVAENICLGREPTLLGRIRWSLVRSRARDALARVGVTLDVNRELSSCPIAIQQLVAIARAIDIRARVLILDEPTSSLDHAEVASLFAVLRRLRDQGMAIVFVTHFLDQVYAISDRIAVLRDGRLVGEHDAADLPRDRLIPLMIGRELSEAPAASSRTHSAAASPPLLEARSLSRRGSLTDVSLSIHKGEVLALAGLLGSGRSETALALFGAGPAESGQISLDGRPRAIESPRAAIALGIGLTPEDRKASGIIPNLSIRENIVLVLQSRRGLARPLSPRQSSDIAGALAHRLGIKAPDLGTPVCELSGGNQQKVLLARWIAAEPRLLILDEPTRGIDIAAKADILSLIRSLQHSGLAVILISSELEEICRAADRAVILRDRRSVATLAASELSQDAIMNAISATHAAT
jgi:monosaccharide-transporting ATPase